MDKVLFGGVPREVKPYNKVRGINKPVLQIKDGVVINRFSSIGEAGRATNIIASCISDVCRGKNKTTGGYVWKYADFEMPKTSKVTAMRTITKKPKKGPFRVVITELCNTEDEAKALLNGLANGSAKINKNSARIIQTRTTQKKDIHNA